jgi:wyosine [tRNA(Phe)-imidazoG37] synthetase (radical SAM superfamily)
MTPLALFEALRADVETRAWRYVYLVWSRRAQGISIGINLHPNHHCNWHCIYCQVPGLQRGPSPAIDVLGLEQELKDCLDWLSQQIQASALTMHRSVQDIAFAGDGEPTTSPQFAEVLQMVAQLLQARSPHDRPANIRLITNGSQLQHAHVQHALKQLHALGGEVWFKVDAGNDAEMLAINDTCLPLSLHMQRLQACCAVCNTWVQTAVVTRKMNNEIITTPSLESYLQALLAFKQQIKGILLYGVARPSQQDSLGCLQATPAVVLEQYAETLRTQGFCVRIFV